MLTLKDIRKDPILFNLIDHSSAYLKARGYTDHGIRHVSYVSETTARILTDLGFDERTIELGAIAGYLHDIGNLINRKHHSISGANIVYNELRRLGMDINEICIITTAIGNHEEEIGKAVTPVASALILADKSDAHRTRAYRLINEGHPGIHDRVNLAITNSRLYVEQKKKSSPWKLPSIKKSAKLWTFSRSTSLEWKCAKKQPLSWVAASACSLMI